MGQVGEGAKQTPLVLALLPKLDATTIASAIMNPSVSANTRSGQKRTRGTADEENPTTPSTAKRPKKETKPDKLKAQLKEAAGRLYDRLVMLQEDLLDKKVAKESAGMIYRALRQLCNIIRTGRGPDEDALALFKLSFMENFEPDEIILNRLGQGMHMLPSRRARLR